MKKFLARLRIGNYIRELTIIFIGFFVSLTITSVISDRTKEREVREGLSLIRLELEQNSVLIENEEFRINKQINGFNYFRKYDLEVRRMSLDSLYYYFETLNLTIGFDPIQDAYDVFKSSGLMQYVSDKNFLQELISTYSTLLSLQKRLKFFDDMKQTGKGLHIMETDQVKKMMGGDLYDTAEVLLDINALRNFIYVGSHDLLSIDISSVIWEVKKMIGRIDQELGYKETTMTTEADNLEDRANVFRMVGPLPALGR